MQHEKRPGSMMLCLILPASWHSREQCRCILICQQLIVLPCAEGKVVNYASKLLCCGDCGGPGVHTQQGRHTPRFEGVTRRCWRRDEQMKHECFNIESTASYLSEALMHKGHVMPALDFKNVVLCPPEVRLLIASFALPLLWSNSQRTYFSLVMDTSS